MSKRYLVWAAVALSACGQVENPLLTATDGEFRRLIEPKNAVSPACAAALYDPELYVKQYNGLKFAATGKIASVGDQHRVECAAELQARADTAGLRGVTREHLADERVRQRYVMARKG